MLKIFSVEINRIFWHIAIIFAAAENFLSCVVWNQCDSDGDFGDDANANDNDKWQYGEDEVTENCCDDNVGDANANDNDQWQYGDDEVTENCGDDNVGDGKVRNCGALLLA